MKVIFSFGDSLTYGAWGRQTHGWTTLLRDYLDTKFEYPSYYYYALGIPGETSRGLVDRFASEVASRRRTDDEAYTFLIACGANDATWLKGEAHFKLDVETYIKNMKVVVDSAKAVGGRIYLLNITPVNENYSREFKGKDKECLNEYVDKYNEAIRLVATNKNVPIIDINSAFEADDIPELITRDGLHPSDAGHQLIFETVTTATEF